MRVDEENARIQDLFKEYETVIYDELVYRLTVANGSTAKKLDLFAAASDTDYYTDSPFAKARELPKGESFMVKEIMVRCPQALPKADIATIFDSASQLVIKEIAKSAIERRYSLRSLGAGGGVQGQYSEAAASDDTLVTHGTPNRGSGLLLPPGDFIFWKEMEQFDCFLASGAAISPAADRILEFVFRGWHAKNAGVVTRG